MTTIRATVTVDWLRNFGWKGLLKMSDTRSASGHSVTPSVMAKAVPYAEMNAKRLGVKPVLMPDIETVSITTYESGSIVVQLNCPHCARVHSVEVPKALDSQGKETARYAVTFEAELHCNHGGLVTLPEWCKNRTSFAQKPRERERKQASTIGADYVSLPDDDDGAFDDPANNWDE